MKTKPEDSKIEEKVQKSNNGTILTTKKKLDKKLVAAALLLLALGLYFSFGTNDAEEYSVVQKWPDGNLKVVLKPGLFWSGPFSKITRFKISDIVSFASKAAKDNTIDNSILVRFKDNGIANVTGTVKYFLPSSPKKIRLIKNELGSNEVLGKKVLRNYINQVFVKTASDYTSSESIRNRSAFINNLTDGLINGLIMSTTKISDRKVASVFETGEDKKVDKLIRYRGPIGRYGITILAFTLHKITYDQQSQAKFDEQRLLEQQTNNAKIQAEKSQQDTITAKAEGEKLLAQTKAREENLKLEAAIRAKKAAEVAKIKAEEEKLVALTSAQKDFEVAKLKLEKSKFEKEVVLIMAEANLDAALKEAEGRKALAEADNSLELRLKTQKDMMVGMATALKDVRVPSAIIGSSGNSSGNPILDIFLMNQLKSLTGNSINPMTNHNE